MRRCAFCGKEADGDEHHAIPKFLYKYLGIKGNPDLFRIILCEKNHKEWSAEWNKIRFALKRLMK